MTGTNLGDGLVWAIVLAASVGTFALRFSFIALFGRLNEIPPRVERALRYVPAAVLTALVVPRLVYLDGSLVFGLENARLVAGSLAGVVAWRTESMTATIAVGMVALWALEWVAVF